MDPLDLGLGTLACYAVITGWLLVLAGLGF